MKKLLLTGLLVTSLLFARGISIHTAQASADDSAPTAPKVHPSHP